MKKRALSKLVNLSVAICLIASIFLTGCASSTPTQSAVTTPNAPRYGGILKIADYGDGASIGYPPKISGVVSIRQAAPAIETLLRMDKTGKPIPWLATDYKNDVVNKTITLTLRKGVKFHDGTDFNAEAVKWNLELYMSTKTAGTEKFKSIDVVDDYSVRINLTEWDNTVTSNFAQTIGMIISPTAFKKNGVDWASSHPVGTGPFEFVSWEKDVRTVYKKFDGYWQKGKPYLDGIEYAPIADSLTRQLSLKSGDIQLGLMMAAKDAAGFEKEGYVVTRTRQGSGALGLAADSANPKSPLADVRVRQAIQYAIDTETLAKTVYSGEAEAANQWIYKGHWGYNPSVVGYPYNPTKAKQLLAEAGYPNGLKTKISYLTTPENDQLITAVQGFLKAVGINAELDPLQRAKWFEMALQGGTWDGLMWAGITPNPDLVLALSTRYAGGGTYKQMLFPDDYKQAIKNAITAPDFEGKQKYAQEAMKLMIDKYDLLTVLLSVSEIGISKSTLHNHGFYQTPNTALWTPEDAWLDK